jgi:hypothetical protein
VVSSIAFKFNVRRSTKAKDIAVVVDAHTMFVALTAGAHTRPLFSSTLAVSHTKYTFNTP